MDNTEKNTMEHFEEQLATIRRSNCLFLCSTDFYRYLDTTDDAYRQQKSRGNRTYFASIYYAISGAVSTDLGVRDINEFVKACQDVSKILNKHQWKFRSDDTLFVEVLCSFLFMSESKSKDCNNCADRLFKLGIRNKHIPILFLLQCNWKAVTKAQNKEQAIKSYLEHVRQLLSLFLNKYDEPEAPSFIPHDEYFTKLFDHEYSIEPFGKIPKFNMYSISRSLALFLSVRGCGNGLLELFGIPSLNYNERLDIRRNSFNGGWITDAGIQVLVSDVPIPGAPMPSRLVLIGDGKEIPCMFIMKKETLTIRSFDYYTALINGGKDYTRHEASFSWYYSKKDGFYYLRGQSNYKEYPWNMLHHCSLKRKTTGPMQYNNIECPFSFHKDFVLTREIKEIEGIKLSVNSMIFSLPWNREWKKYKYSLKEPLSTTYNDAYILVDNRTLKNKKRIQIPSCSYLVFENLRELREHYCIEVKKHLYTDKEGKKIDNQRVKITQIDRVMKLLGSYIENFSPIDADNTSKLYNLRNKLEDIGNDWLNNEIVVIDWQNMHLLDIKTLQKRVQEKRRTLKDTLTTMEKRKITIVKDKENESDSSLQDR